jgi:hypothetical protein
VKRHRTVRGVFAALAALALAALALIAQAARYSPPVQIATLADPQIVESSGLAASWRNPGLFWTHNDSGGGPFVYAFDRTGAARGTWRVTGAEARDWEDMAIGPGPEPGRPYLYLADFGDNNRVRTEGVLYRVPEPNVTPADAESTEAAPRKTGLAEAIRFRYHPGVSHNAEALLVHLTTGDIYIVTKSGDRDPATLVYQAAAPEHANGLVEFERVATLKLSNIWRPVGNIHIVMSAMVTGGDISPDGRRVILATYGQGFELALPDGAPFDEIWSQTPVPVGLGARAVGESVCYRRDGLAILAGSEGRNSPLYEMVRTR